MRNQAAQVKIRVPSGLKAWLERKSSQEERSQNWLIGKILEKAMQEDEQREQATA
ncbi:hypothetical protein [Azorhizophilus paspali]|uniref:Arc-like DNA binding domain-containing protein n=1 Tax=Azorhizophilus paspali TaxID=69963 RepID=A0ABV6SMI1_AZOPA